MSAASATDVPAASSGETASGVARTAAQTGHALPGQGPIASGATAAAADGGGSPASTASTPSVQAPVGAPVAPRAPGAGAATSPAHAGNQASGAAASAQGAASGDARGNGDARAYGGGQANAGVGANANANAGGASARTSGASASSRSRASATAAPAQAAATPPPTGGPATNPLLTIEPGTQAPLSAHSAAASAHDAPGVGMHEMIESINATIQIAVRQGATQARIALHPEELGQINIRLSQTSQGLLARVSAETPAAAQALAAGRAELHQSLSSLGVSLLRLDIGFGQPESGDRQGAFAGDPSFPGASSSSRASSTLEELEGPEAPDQSDASVRSASPIGGALVDVLA